MRILIKDMEMPKSCDKCVFSCWSIVSQTAYCLRLHEPCFEDYSREYLTARADFCPLVPVPPHGRLIDADALKIDIVKKLGISDRRYLLPAENAIWTEINKAPTVIPAEGAAYI